MSTTQTDQPTPNAFAALAALDVSQYVEKKGQFSYLSWAWAVDQLCKAHADARWEIKRFDGAPYLKTECGYFVEVAVTVAGRTVSQIHPVLDARNKPIAQPNAFEINTSIQRCLVKAIALHGLGLYVYAGEDLPEGAEAPKLTQEQAATLAALITSQGRDLAKFCAYFHVERLDELPAADFARALSALNKQAKPNGPSAGSGPALVISENQLVELVNLMNAVEADQVKFLAYLDVTALAELPAAKYGYAKQALAAKRKAEVAHG